MNKENKGLILGATITLFLGIIFIVMYQLFIPTTAMDKVFGKKVKTNLEEVINVLPTTGNYELIHKKRDVMDKDEAVGAIYTLAIKNSFGDIEVLVGIDKDDKVYVYGSSIQQAHYNYKNMNERIIQFINKHYRNKTYQEIESLSTGSFNVGDQASSGASVSTSSIHQLVMETLKLYFNIEDETDPMKDEFGEGYQIVKDESFVPTTHVIEKHDVKVNDEIKGYRYVMQVEAAYSGEKGKGLVTIVMTYNLEGKIILFETGTPYEHTTGDGHRPRIRAFLTSLQETNVSDLEANVVANKELTSGSTETYTAVSKMILGFVAEILKAQGGNEA